MQIAFAYFYGNEKNATQAAKAAGYSEKTAKQKANSLLKDERVCALIHAHEQLKAIEKKVNSKKENEKPDKAFVLKTQLEILTTSIKKIPIQGWAFDEKQKKMVQTVVGEKMVDAKAALAALSEISAGISEHKSSVSEQTIKEFIDVLNDTVEN